MGRVMVVDDNADTCKVLSAFLKLGGHAAVCATSVPSAMLKLIDADQKLPDVVITDLMMPEKSGVDLIREIRATIRCKDVPIIVYSAVSEPRYVEQAMDAGATDYWLKGALRAGDLARKLQPYLPGGDGWADAWPHIGPAEHV